MTARCELHQPSLRYHLFAQFADDDDCLRVVLRRYTLYLYYPTILMIGELTDKVKTALTKTFTVPLDDRLRNLLCQPPREVWGKLLSEPLHQRGVIEFSGKIEHDDAMERIGKETFEYRIHLDRICELFRQFRLEYDVYKAIACLRGENGISEQLLIEKFEALYVLPLSHARARLALCELERQGVLRKNGKLREWGRDVLKLS